MILQKLKYSYNSIFLMMNRSIAVTNGILVHEFGLPDVMKMADSIEIPTLQSNQVVQ